MPAWSWMCNSRSLLKTSRDCVFFSPATIVRARDCKRLTSGCCGVGGGGGNEWVGGWVCALEGTPDSPLVAQQWQTAAGGDRMSGEVWARETHKSFISSGLRFPPLWKSVGVCGRTWLPYQQQDVLVFCFPCTWVLTRVCKHKLNSAMPQ